MLSFGNEDDITSFSKYYTPNVEIKHVSIDGKSFFGTPVRNKVEAYEKLFDMGKGNDYTAVNLLDYEYFSKHYKLIAIDVSNQIVLENNDLTQQINFTDRLDRDEGAAMFFIVEKTKKTIFYFSQNAVSII